MIKGWKKTTLGEACRIEKGKASAANEPVGIYPLVTTGEERKTAANWQFDCPAVCVPMISAFGHGKAGLKRVHYQEGKFALASILCALIIKNPKELSAKFLSVFLNFYKDQLIVPLQFGAANMSITVERLATVPIWFPSFQEQERILGLTDEAESLQVMRARANARMEQFIPALFQEMFGDPFKNEKKYNTQKLGETIKVRSGKFLPSKEMQSEGGFPVYGGNGINGFHDKYMFEDPVIVIGRVGYYCGIVHLTKPRSWITDNALYVSEIKNPNVLELYLIQNLRLLNLNQFASTSAQPLISAGKIYSVPITIPPVKSQIRFIEIVNEVEKTEEVLLKSENRINKIYNSILSNVFTGNV